MENEQTKKQIKNQIEYYLSDKNLEQDEFFHKLISEDNEGYLNIDHIMQCNKIKNAKWTKDQILSAIEDSTQIEANKEKTMIRRKNNKPLPILNLEKLTNKKRSRDKNDKKGDKIIPIILTIKSDKNTEIKWKDIETKYKTLNPTLTVLYTRFKENEGNFGVYPMGANYTDGESLNFVKEFNIEDIKFTVSECEGKDLEKFKKENQSHLDYCVNRERAKKINKKNNTNLLDPITLGNEEYIDISRIKEKIRKMMSQVKEEMIVLNDDECKFMKDLVKYHPDKEICDKVKDVKFIGVGKINPHEYTKAFFGLNDKKEKLFEFFVHKCPEKILIDDRKKYK